MVWAEIRTRKLKGRKEGRSRTAYYVRVRWPSGTGKAPRSDPESLRFHRKADAERRGRQLVEMVQAFESGTGNDPWQPRDDREQMIANYRTRLAAGGLGKPGHPPPSDRQVALNVGRLTRLLEWLSIDSADQLARWSEGATVAINTLQRSQSWSMATRNAYVAVLKQLGRALHEAGSWPANLLTARVSHINADAHRTFERRALTPDETERVILAAAERPVAGYRRMHPDAPIGKLRELQELGWTRGTFYMLAADCGWRLGELKRTTWGDIDLTDGRRPRIAVKARVAKSRRAESVPIGEATAARLRQLRDLRASNQEPCGPADLVFGDVSAGTLRDHLKLDAAHAGLGEVKVTHPRTPAGNQYRRVEWIDPTGADQRIDVHALRTSYITSVVLHVPNLMLAQKLVRHANITTTQRHYAKIDQNAVDEAADAIPRAGVSRGALVDLPGGPVCGPVDDSENERRDGTDG